MAKTVRTIFKSCRECRQKRARCDSRLPCERCSTLGFSCVYDKRPGETKDRLRAELATLQARKAASTIILEALATRQDDQEALIALWRQDSIEEIAKELTRRRKATEGQHITLTHGQNSKPEDDLDGDDGVPVMGSERTFLSDVAPSEMLPRSTVIDQLDLAANECPSEQQPTHPNFSSPEDTKPLNSIETAHETSFPEEVSPLPYRSHETSPQSHYYGSSSYSPILEKSDRAAFMAPSHAGQMSPIAGPSIQSPNVSASLANLKGEHWEQMGLMVIPFEMTRECIETFFEKQYTPFPRIRQDLFMEDFMTGKKGYCSSALVRILCCMGCRIKGGYDASQTRHAGIGDRLFEEALQLVRASDGTECNVPDAQALGLMGLHQLGAGRYEQARELADEGVRRLDLMYRQSDGDHKIGLSTSVQATNLFGAISLARMIRLTVAHALYSKPSVRRDGLPMNMSQKAFAARDAQLEQLLSLPGLVRVNQLDDDQAQLPALLFQLTDWIYAFLSRLQVVEGDSLPRHLRDTYHACLSWYSTTLARGDGQKGPSPFVHLYYHFCLLSLFRPFCEVKSADVLPVEICAESADAILTLTTACRQLDGFQMMCFVPLFVHAAAQSEWDSAVGREEAKNGSVRSSVVDSGGARGESSESDASKGSSLCGLSGDKETARRSLTDRALEQLVQLSEWYPSARKAASELQSISSRRVS